MLFPIVNGKPSKLYQELYTLTQKDRKLTNLLYALSKQDECKKMFGHSDLNSQGEPNTKVFIDKLDVKEILNEKANIASEAKALGAITHSGKPVYFADMMSITQRVIDFNNNHDKMKATIKYSDKGYYIEVGTLNAENFNTNNVLNNRINLYNEIINHLANNGLNTNLSIEAKKALNPLSIYYSINRLKDLKSSTDNLNMTTTSLIIDLFNADPWIQNHLLPQFGNDLAQAISQVSGYKYSNPINITQAQEAQIKKFLNKVQLKMKKVMNSATIDQVVENAKAGTTYTQTYLGTDGVSVNDALKELYTVYHLDKDNLNSLNKKAKKISDASNQLLQIQVARLNEQRLKHGATRGERKLIKAQKEIEQGRYLASTVMMLENLVNTISTQEAKIDKLDKRLAKDPESLVVIQRYSKLLLDQLDLVKSFEPIIKQLKNADLLEDDDLTGNSQLIDDIRDLATELGETLDRIESNARSKQYDVVYSFLKIYWGEDKTLPDGTKVELGGENGIMNMAITDINFFDRFIYAVNTTNDEMMNIIAEAVKQAHEKRDAKLRQQLKEVRAITKELYDSGSSTSFMFERDINGYPKKIISDYDYEKFDNELAAYKEQIRQDSSIDKKDYDALEKDWMQKHSKTVKYIYTDSNGNQQKLSLTVPIYDAATTVKDRLTTAQYNYYKKMMDMKAEMLSKIDAASNNSLFDVIELANDLTTAVGEAGTDPSKIYQLMKNKVVDMFGTREDDTDYGSILDDNNVKLTHVNSRGESIDTLPIFYTHKIKDRSRVSTDFSRSMMTYLASSQQYIQMNGILDSLLLAKDYMLTQRPVQQTSGGSTLLDIQKLGKQSYVSVASKMGIATDLGGLADDFFERCVYGKTRKDEGYLFGTKVKLDKAVDFLTGYTSITGLAVNTLGAEANLLVGKLQMLIESGLGMGGEFFNMKDYVYADAKYMQLIGPLLNECMSNSKSSLLGVMMERFDVLDDFYEKIKETGFYKNPLGKIIGNTNLFFLYGIGEHMLHAQGMLAVLHNQKNNVLDSNGKEVPLIEALEVVKDSTGNGELAIKSGYTLKDGSPITEEHLNKIKRRIAYVNKSMHGAFGQMDKGMIHRYAIGRLIMNFRQWMPAHYSRRFRGLHYDTDLGEYREGYYVSTAKFLWGCAKDLKDKRLTIATRWHELSDMERYNLKRAIAETAIFAMLAASLALIGPAKDHKGNWARRHLIYELKRMQMETRASTPLAGGGFVRDITKIINSPVAAISTIDKISKVLDLTDAFTVIENGKYKGENLYIHNLEKSLPFYGQIVKMLELGESDDLFILFN